MSEQGLLQSKALLGHCRAQWMLFGTFTMSWTFHGATTDTPKMDKVNNKETSNVGNTFLQWTWSQPRLLIDVHSTGASSAHCPGGLTTQQ